MAGAGEREGRSPRCVLWHRPGDRPEALVTSLQHRGIAVTDAESPYAALAEVCRALGTAGGASAVSLVMVEPGSLGREPEVARAAARYAPKAVIWAFRAADRQALRPVTESDIQGWEHASGPRADPPVPVVIHRNGSGARPHLRLTADAPESAGSAPHAPVPPQPEHLLTQEELAMLLADEEPGGTMKP